MTRPRWRSLPTCTCEKPLVARASVVVIHALGLVEPEPDLVWCSRCGGDLPEEPRG